MSDVASEPLELDDRDVELDKPLRELVVEPERPAVEVAEVLLRDCQLRSKIQSNTSILTSWNWDSIGHQIRLLILQSPLW